MGEVFISNRILKISTRNYEQEILKVRFSLQQSSLRQNRASRGVARHVITQRNDLQEIRPNGLEYNHKEMQSILAI